VGAIDKHRLDKRRSKPVSALKFPLMLVEWVDASRLSDSWVDLSAVPAAYLHRCLTVGFLISDTKDGKILVPTIGDVEHPSNSHTYGGMLIPRGAIISERRLR
jgi:hypothetical protein